MTRCCGRRDGTLRTNRKCAQRSPSPALLRSTIRLAGTEVSEEEETRRTDYVLLAANGRPLAVTEAKRGRIDPYTAKEQTLPMAKHIGAPFIFLSNGELTYFWDYENDDARIVSSFYSRRDLERLLYLRKEAKPLATVPIPDDFIRVGEVRIVRPYQKEVLRALDHAVELGKRRFLVELPTGTGKTDVICLHSQTDVQSRAGGAVAVPGGPGATGRSRRSGHCRTCVRNTAAIGSSRAWRSSTSKSPSACSRR